MKAKKAVNAVIAAGLMVVGLVTGVYIPEPAKAAIIEGGAAVVELRAEVLAKSGQAVEVVVEVADHLFTDNKASSVQAARAQDRPVQGT